MVTRSQVIASGIFLSSVVQLRVRLQSAHMLLLHWTHATIEITGPGPVLSIMWPPATNVPVIRSLFKVELRLDHLVFMINWDKLSFKYWADEDIAGMK